MYAMTVILYLGQDFFELLIARHDCLTCPPAPGATQSQDSGSHRSHTVFFGILENSAHRNISYLQVCPRPGPKANRGVGLSWRGPGCPISGDISQWTDRHLITFGCSRAPFASLDFSLVMFTSFIPWLVTQVHTDSAGKGPLCSSYSEAFVSSMSRTSPVWGMRVEKS